MHTIMIAAATAGAGRTTLTAGLGLYAQEVEDGLVVSLYQAALISTHGPIFDDR